MQAIQCHGNCRRLLRPDSRNAYRHIYTLNSLHCCSELQCIPAAVSATMHLARYYPILGALLAVLVDPPTGAQGTYNLQYITTV